MKKKKTDKDDENMIALIWKIDDILKESEIETKYHLPALLVFASILCRSSEKNTEDDFVHLAKLSWIKMIDWNCFPKA